MNFIQQTRLDASSNDPNNKIEDPLNIPEIIDFSSIENASSFSIKGFCKIYSALVDSTDIQDSYLHVPFLSLLEEVTDALIPNLACFWDSLRPSTIPAERLRVKELTIRFLISIWNLPQTPESVKKELLLGTIQKLILRSPERSLFRDLVVSSISTLILSFPQFLFPSILLLVSFGHNISVFKRLLVVHTLSVICTSLELHQTIPSDNNAHYDTRVNPAKFLKAPPKTKTQSKTQSKRQTYKFDNNQDQDQDQDSSTFLLPIVLPSKFKKLDSLENTPPSMISNSLGTIPVPIMSFPKLIFYFLLQRVSDKSFSVRSAAIAQLHSLYKNRAESFTPLWREIIFSTTNTETENTMNTPEKNAFSTPRKKVRFGPTITSNSASSKKTSTIGPRGALDTQEELNNWHFFALLNARTRDQKPFVRRSALSFLSSILSGSFQIPDKVISGLLPAIYDSCSDTSSIVRRVAISCFNIIIQSKSSQLIYSSWAYAVFPAAFSHDAKISSLAFDSITQLVLVPISKLFESHLSAKGISISSDAEIAFKDVINPFEPNFTLSQVLSVSPQSPSPSIPNHDLPPAWKYLVVGDPSAFEYLTKVLSLLFAKWVTTTISLDAQSSTIKDQPKSKRAQKRGKKTKNSDGGAVSVNLSHFLLLLQHVCFYIPFELPQSMSLLQHLSQIAECVSTVKPELFPLLLSKGSPVFLGTIIQEPKIFIPLLSLVTYYSAILSSLLQSESKIDSEIESDDDVISKNDNYLASSSSSFKTEFHTSVFLSRDSKSRVLSHSSDFLTFTKSFQLILDFLFKSMVVPHTVIPHIILALNQYSKLISLSGSEPTSHAFFNFSNVESICNLSSSTLDETFLPHTKSVSNLLLSTSETGNNPSLPGDSPFPVKTNSQAIFSFLSLGFSLLFNSQLTESEADLNTIIKALHPVEKLISSSNVRKRLIGYSTIGIACLESSTLASRYMPILIHALDIPDQNSTLKSTLLIIVCEIFLRNTNLVVKFLPIIVNSLYDSNPHIRRQSIILISRLVQESYIKQNTPVVFFPLLTKLCDSDMQVQLYAQYSIFQVLAREDNFLSGLFPAIFYQFNHCETTQENQYSKSHYDPNSKFVSPLLSKKHRQTIYFACLSHLSDPHKFNVQSRIVKTLLASIVEDPSILDDSPGISLLRDALAVLASSALTIHIHKQSEEDRIEEDQNTETGDSSSNQKLSAVNLLLSKDICDNILPVVLDLKKILVARRSPLMRNLLEFVNRLQSEFPETLSDAVLLNTGLGDELAPLSF